MARRTQQRYQALSDAERNGTTLTNRQRRGQQRRADYLAQINQARAKAEQDRQNAQVAAQSNYVQGATNAAAIATAATIGKNNAMASATNDQIRRATQGSTRKAEIDAEQQLVNTADYSNATFANAVIQQNTVAHENAVASQLNWNNLKYRQGKRGEAEVSRDADVARTNLYARGDYIASRQNQNQAVISGEITKMYADQFSRMSMSEVMAKLNDTVAGSTVANRSEQFAAAAQSLIQSGQADKVREIISGGERDSITGRYEYEDAATNFGTLMQNDESFRNKVSQVLGSSGEFTFQEYAKHLGQEGASARSFRDWSDATDNKSLRASIATKGLDKMDKDGLAYLANHVNALNGASSENIAKVAASTTDTATVGKLVEAIKALDPSKRNDIMKATSGAQFVSMNENVRVALSGGGTAGDTAWQNYVGDALKNDPQLRGRLTDTEQGRYVKP